MCFVFSLGLMLKETDRLEQEVIETPVPSRELAFIYAKTRDNQPAATHN
jgi:hypothetical protein